MKTVMSKFGLLFRLGVTATALLLGQQALALGTDAGTSVSNQATVSYSVGGAAQTPIESDRRQPHVCGWLGVRAGHGYSIFGR